MIAAFGQHGGRLRIQRHGPLLVGLEVSLYPSLGAVADHPT
jgi:hypothetical protein